MSTEVYWSNFISLFEIPVGWLIKIAKCATERTTGQSYSKTPINRYRLNQGFKKSLSWPFSMTSDWYLASESVCKVRNKHKRFWIVEQLVCKELTCMKLYGLCDKLVQFSESLMCNSFELPVTHSRSVESSLFRGIQLRRIQLQHFWLVYVWVI